MARPQRIAGTHTTPETNWETSGHLQAVWPRGNRAAARNRRSSVRVLTRVRVETGLVTNVLFQGRCVREAGLTDRWIGTIVA